MSLTLYGETPEAKALRREFRLQQVAVLELHAVGIGSSKEAQLGAMKTEMACLKMMEEANMNISGHSRRSFTSSTAKSWRSTHTRTFSRRQPQHATNPQA